MNNGTSYEQWCIEVRGMMAWKQCHYCMWKTRYMFNKSLDDNTIPIRPTLFTIVSYPLCLHTCLEMKSSIWYSVSMRVWNIIKYDINNSFICIYRQDHLVFSLPSQYPHWQGILRINTHRGLILKQSACALVFIFSTYLHNFTAHFPTMKKIFR